MNLELLAFLMICITVGVTVAAYFKFKEKKYGGYKILGVLFLMVVITSIVIAIYPENMTNLNQNEENKY